MIDINRGDDVDKNNTIDSEASSETENEMDSGSGDTNRDEL